MMNSNQKRLKKYTQDRRIEEENNDIHQDLLDAEIAKELGLEVQATNLAKMAKRVVSQLGETVINNKGTSYLKNAISSGKLSDLFDMIKGMNTDGLSKKEKIIISDIKNKKRRKELTDIFNERLRLILARNLDQAEFEKEVEQEFIDITGGGDKDLIENIIKKASKVTKKVGRPTTTKRGTRIPL